MSCRAFRLAFVTLFLGLGLAARGQVNPNLYAGLRWRLIGPFRAGRVAAVTGAVGKPGTFYIGLPQGGAWKTTSAGMTWYPVMDSVAGVDSVGAIETAPSNPNIVYAGTGENINGSPGHGMYKSTDAGKTWTHMGLDPIWYINAILVDPENPNIVLAATGGDSRSAGPDRGVYRTSDGGQSWKQVLHPDDSTAVSDIAWAQDKPSVVFATTISDVRPVRGAGGAAPGRGAPLPNRTHLYKSTDEGVSWSEVTGAAAPPMAGRMGVAVGMHTDGQRVYLIENAPRGGGSGLYRSDDQGASWRRMAEHDGRITNGQGNYSCGVWVDTENPDILYTVSTATYRSSDGGNTFVAFKGAPGGDDYHNIWIDPTHPERMILGVDQGATVTLDGGRTWSSWYNQATDQVYHIDTDTRYPYWVAASQQDSGSTMIRSRSDLGQITMMTDWWPLPASEFGSVAMDPVHPGIIYAVGYGAGGSAGSITKISQETGQWENVAPNQSPDSYYRPGATVRRFDTVFNPNALYAAYQCLTVTTDGGQTWRDFSPDLTVALGKPAAPCKPAAGAAAPAPGGFGRGPTIADFSISAAKAGVFWTASSNGEVYRTVDNGAQWTNVTHFTDLPEGDNGRSTAVIPAGFNTIEAGHFDANTAYVTMDRAGAGDDNPYIWKTHDGGQSWTRIVNGLPANNRPEDYVWVVREDAVQRGLLYCGTESGVYVSFDDGGNWQPLQLNLPMTAVRDMVLHTADHMNDLVIGTYGRSLWVLDDLSPLREIAAHAAQIEAAPAYLFQPGDAIRARQNVNWDTPIPPDIARASNPPYGAIIYYYLAQKPAGEVKLQILDAAGNLVRTYSSVPQPETNMPPDTVAPYWLATPESLALPTAAGTNRAHWDLRYEDPAAVSRNLEDQMNSLPHQVTPGPHGPKALPGTYTVKLTVDGQVYSQPLVVRNDPRIGESAATMAALAAQHRLTMLGYQAMKDSYAANEEVAAVRAQVAQRSGGNAPSEVATAGKALETKLTAFGGPSGGRGGRGGFGPPPPGAPRVVSFSALNRNFDSLVEVGTIGIDMAPTPSQIEAWEADCNNYNATLTAWKAMQTGDLAAFNAVLSRNNLPPLALSPTPVGDPACTFTAAPAAKGKRGKRK